MLQSIETPATRVQSMICPVPFYHVYGAVNCLMTPIYQGVKSVLMPKFEMTEFLRCIDEYQITHAWVVPPILLGLLGHPREFVYAFMWNRSRAELRRQCWRTTSWIPSRPSFQPRPLSLPESKRCSIKSTTPTVELYTSLKVRPTPHRTQPRR